MRINILNPRCLADQHLIAEYNEIRMALKVLYKYRKRKSIIPKNYCLGTGHINFFKDKILYLAKRRGQIIAEMMFRGFKMDKRKGIPEGFPEDSLNDWEPNEKDKQIIKARIASRLEKRPGWYRYYGKYYDVEFFKKLLQQEEII